MKIISVLKENYPDCVIELDPASESLQNCEGTHRHVPFLFRPYNKEQVISFVKLCNNLQQAFYVYSRGHNWGYGTKMPVQNNCVQLDLSNLNKITNMDEELGLVEIQAGVCQQELLDFLNTNKSKWGIPTTGAGPKGSIIGNALDRGFGLNPLIDHCSAIVSLEVLLADGRILRSRLAELGAEKSDLVSKWKIGPYLEGLFSQSNFGVVLSAQIELAPLTQKVHLCVIKSSTANLPKLIEIIHLLREKLPGNIGGINFSSKERANATFGVLEKNQKSWVYKFLESFFDIHFKDWQALVPILVYDQDLKIQSVVCKALRSSKLEFSYLSDDKIEFLAGLARRFKTWIPSALFEMLDDIRNLKNLIKGQPSSFALEVAYFLKPTLVKTNPAQDGVGLYWFAPILRLKAADLHKIISITQEVLHKYQRPNLFSFLNFDNKLCEATIPLYYDKASVEDHQKAKAAWDELYKQCQAEGFVPYRYSIEHMEYSQVRDCTHHQISQMIKKSLDPHNIISPGRYE